jgi:maltooligosyltrehalose trehalohydrolase
MTAFRVWAPLARRVRVRFDGRTVELTPSRDDGYFEAEVPEAGPGTDYRYSLDDGAWLPDPRSAHQPEGVHGPSRVVDHGCFPWTDSGYSGFHLPSAILYELHVGTFSEEGTFDGAIRHLDHLVDLGVTAVELLPVAEFSGSRGWGYDGVYPYAPHSAYGGPEALKRLVDACHARRLGVLLDVVYNHVGPAGNYLPAYGPYFTERYATPWGKAPNLDGPDSDAVRAFVCDNALSWLSDYHFDGLRLDAVHAIVDTSARHILEELSDRVETLASVLGRPLWLVAESDLNDPRIVERKEAGGYGMDAQWSDDFHHALHALLTGERHGIYQDFGSVADLAAAFSRVFVYGGRYSSYRRRVHGRSPCRIPSSRFVVFSQNHDQVGNRARGERTSALLSPALTRVAAALVLASPFVPLLFQGEEWGATTPFLYFTDHADPDLARAVREGRAREFAFGGPAPEGVPDPQAEETFARSKLDWSEPLRPPHAELLAWYRRLIELRRTHPAFRGARRERPVGSFDEANRWLLVDRGGAYLAANLGDRAVEVPIPRELRPNLLLASAPCETQAGRLRLEPESVAIFE